ncbi:Microtubule bundling protein [Lecanora helva]
MDTSYLTTQVSTIIGQLHGLFDEIGVPNHEREARESELFTALSETLHNQLRLVTAEKSELTEEANRIIKTIKQMEASLVDRASSDSYQLDDKHLKITVPLNECLQTLKEKHNAIARLHRERFEQVKKLVQALESYSLHLESSFVRVKLPPTSNGASPPPTFDLSPSYVASLDKEFSRVYEEYSRRIATVKGLAEEIVNFWAELGTPQAQTESSIVKYYRDAPEQLGLHADDIKRLHAKRDRLAEEKRGRERKLKELKVTVEGLWDRLGVEETDRKRFLAGNRGCGLRAINEFEAELDRLNELKRQNLHLFVEDARYKLQELWDGLYFSEEEMLEFAPAFSDVYSDALLSAHEAEISRLEALKEQRAPTLQLIDKHRSLIKDRDDLSAASQDASRLLAKNNKGEKRDPTRLLREEKMRKRIAKDLPKIEADLRKTLERWEDDYGRPFLVHGSRYLDELEAAAAKSLPPRSKTPSGPAPTTQKIPLKSAPAPASSRAGSVMRANPPSRAGTATPAGTLRRNPLASSVSTAGGRTPSKIPARVPLGSTQNGGNSPERRGPPPETSYDTNTIRKMGPPARAPPPKMRDLFEPPPPPKATLRDAYDRENIRCESVASSHDSGSVRHVSPEDVYDDRERMSYVPTSMMQSSRMAPQTYHNVQYPGRPDAQYQQQNQYVPTADSRQISTTSTANTAASGSENWETFDDASEPEVDASEAYYAKLRAVKTGKRFTPEGGYTPPRGGPGKKYKGMYASGGAHQQMMIEEGGGGRRLVTGSESAWTDEDVF